MFHHHHVIKLFMETIYMDCFVFWRDNIYLSTRSDNVIDVFDITSTLFLL